MTSPPSQRIGIVTCGAEKLADNFPTAAEPDFVPTEPPVTPDDQLLVDELQRRGHQAGSEHGSTLTGSVVAGVREVTSATVATNGTARHPSAPARTSKAAAAGLP